MKPLAAACFLLAASASLAQVAFGGWAKEAGKAIADRLQQRPTNPLEPREAPGLPPRDGRLPTPQEDARPVLTVVSANSFRREGDRVYLDGNVHALYRGYDLYAEHISGDLVTNVFRLVGGAQLVGKSEIIKADSLTVDLDAQTFSSESSFSQLKPERLQGRTVDDVYFFSSRAQGSPREIHSHDGWLTTCNLDHPHFRFDVRQMTVRPGKRLILRNVKVIVLDRHILTIPYLSIPLDDRRERYTTTVGQDPVAGTFIKNRLGVALRGNEVLDVDLDYYSKLGFGLGGRFGYADASFDGYLHAYGIFGQTNTLEVQSQHTHDFGRGIVLTLNNNYQRQNQFNAPQNTSLQSNFQLVVPRSGNQNLRTTINYTRTSNEAPGFFSRNQSWRIHDSGKFGPFRTTINLGYSSNESGSANGTPIKREQVQVGLTATRDVSKGQFELRYNRSIPVGEVANFFSAQDVTPVLSFRSDSSRWFAKGKGSDLRMNTEVSVGEFGDAGTRERVTRTFIDFNLNQAMKSEVGFGAGVQGRFRQGVYSDDTAQYSLQFNPTLRYGFTERTGLNIRYSYLKSHGFTPLAIDRVGSVNLATADLSYLLRKDLTFGVQTGYDFLAQERTGTQTPWQQVGMRLEYRPNQDLDFRALPIYDTFNKRWSNVRMDLNWWFGDTALSVGTRYDAPRHTWANVNVRLDGLKVGKTRFSLLGAYNGYLSRFESVWYSAIYDLHCWEAVLQVSDNTTGFRSGRQVFFFLRMKAFPFDTPFGTGTRGQPIGTGTGFGF